MGILDSIVNFFSFEVAFFCFSLELGSAINAFILIIIGLISQIIMVFNKSVWVADYSYSSFALLYFACAYLIEGIVKKKESYIFPFCVMIPYTILQDLYVFIKSDEEIMIKMGAEGWIGRLAVHLVEALVMTFMFYSWIVAVRLYKTIAPVSNRVTLTGISSVQSAAFPLPLTPIELTERKLTSDSSVIETVV